MNTKLIDELIETNKMYQLVTERLEVKNPDSEDVFARFSLESELMQQIVALYDSDENFQFQKLQKFSIAQVLEYLQASHRYYLTKKLPEIEQSMQHVFNKYSESHQLLTSLTVFFNDYKNKLIAHIKMEEKEFFPYIKKLISANKGDIDQVEVDFLLANTSIEDFNDEHDPIEDELKTVSNIIYQNSESKTAPMPYRVFLNQVELFELELRKHAIIEDFVLVPMAKELEKKLRNAS
jgi:regulator of cell morphogenesis and NO signaling